MPSEKKLSKMFGPSSKVLKVRADTLQPHPLAQRELVPSRLKKLIATLDLDAIGVLHCVQYPIKGKTAMWVIDGQHRWRALLDRGCGEWEVEIKLHLDATDDARASALFLKLNDRSPVRPFDKFLNRLRAKESDAIAINDTVLKYGLVVSANAGDGKLNGIAALEKTYKLDDGEALEKTLGVTTSAWGKRSIDAKLIEGIGILFARYNGTIDQPAMIKKLSKYAGGPTAVLGDARQRMEWRKTNLARCVAEQVIDEYNKQRKVGRLDPL